MPYYILLSSIEKGYPNFYLTESPEYFNVNMFYKKVHILFKTEGSIRDQYCGQESSFPKVHYLKFHIVLE